MHGIGPDALLEVIFFVGSARDVAHLEQLNRTWHKLLDKSGGVWERAYMVSCPYFSPEEWAQGCADWKVLAGSSTSWDIHPILGPVAAAPWGRVEHGQRT
jgi:hypothetical protein